MVDVVDTHGITETLFLDSFRKTTSVELIHIALGTMCSLELEVSTLEYLFEWKFCTVVSSLPGKNVDTLALTLLAVVTALVDLLWWLFFTEALMIEGIQLHSPFVSETIASDLFSDVLMAHEES